MYLLIVLLSPLSFFWFLFWRSFLFTCNVKINSYVTTHLWVHRMPLFPTGHAMTVMFDRAFRYELYHEEVGQLFRGHRLIGLYKAAKGLGTLSVTARIRRTDKAFAQNVCTTNFPSRKKATSYTRDVISRVCFLQCMCIR